MGTVPIVRHPDDVTLSWKRPTHFWPVVASSEQEAGDEEKSGIYLHRDRFGGGIGRAGNTILALVQGPVLINLRRC